MQTIDYINMEKGWENSDNEELIMVNQRDERKKYILAKFNKNAPCHFNDLLKSEYL